MGVLQTAVRIVGNLEPQVILGKGAPEGGNICCLSLASKEHALNVVAQHDV